MIWKDGILCAPGRPVKGDRMVGSLRVWPPGRSKLAALCYLGRAPDIKPDVVVLYLGAASGTTVSFLSDYVRLIYAVEIACEPLSQLLDVCKLKKNIIPLPCDAAHPEEYRALVEEVDLLYQDVAQRDQADILIKNLPILKTGGTVILMLKLRSISAREDPAKICDTVISALELAGLTIIEAADLQQYYHGHIAIVGIKNQK